MKRRASATYRSSHVHRSAGCSTTVALRSSAHGPCSGSHVGGSSGDGITAAAAPMIVFGGLFPHPTRASKTEALLAGKNIADQATLKLALQSLESEFAAITG